MSGHCRLSHPANRRVSGFGLVELMIALVLGLIVVGGALSLFASNRQAFRATEGLSRLQENARIGFELMARDVRDAGGTPCAKNLPMANVINGGAGNWWTSWGNGIDGYDGAQALPGVAFGTAAAERLAGTDAVVVHSGGATGVSVNDAPPSPSNAAAPIIVNSTSHGFIAGDILLICDYGQSALFQASSIAGASIGHMASGTPGNFTQSLGLPIGTLHGFLKESTVTRLHAVAWYIGNNSHGGTSLYRKLLNNNPDEIADGVTDLQLSYLVPTQAAYADATSASVSSAWQSVNAVRIAFTTDSAESVGTNGLPLTRNVVHYAALRNRNQ